MQNEGGGKSTGSRSGLDSNPDYPKIAAYNLEAPELSARQLSPLRLLATIIGGIFLAEVIAMLVVYAIGPMPFFYITVIDAGVMTALIFPLLFFLSFRPLLRYINKNRQAEEKNHLLSSIVEQTADTVVVTDRVGVIEYVNPAFEQMTGYAKEEALGKTPRVLKSGVHDDQFYKELWNTILSGEVYQSEIANLKRNGELFYEVKTITPLRDALGAITHFVATGKDITERKQAEEQLRKAYDDLELRILARTEELRIANSELEEEITERRRVENMLQQQAEELELQAEELQAQKRGLVVANEKLIQIRLDLDQAQEVGQIGSWRLDIQRNVLAWSDENYRIFGVPAGTPLTYETFLEIVHPDDRQYVDTQWTAGLAGEPYDIEHRIVVDGQVKWVREKAYLEFDGSGTPLGGFGITQDISERVRAEEALRESETRYRTLVENAPVGIYAIDLVNRKLTSVNDVLCTETGYSREELLSMDPADLLVGEYKAIFLERLQRMMGGQTVPGSIEYKVRTKSGRLLWALLNVNFTRKDGLPLAARVIATDVTERKRAEDALRESEERYRLALDAATLGTWRHDLATGFLSLDERARAHSGFDSTTVTFAQVLALIHPDDVARVESEINTALDPAISAGYYATEYRIVHPYNGIRWVSVQANAYFEGQGATRRPVQVIGLSQDITERKQAEAALRAANEELTRFNTLMVGRELRMIELKKEVNELCGIAGQEQRYPLDFEKELASPGNGSKHAEA